MYALTLVLFILFIYCVLVEWVFHVSLAWCIILVLLRLRILDNSQLPSVANVQSYFGVVCASLKACLDFSQCACVISEHLSPFLSMLVRWFNNEAVTAQTGWSSSKVGLWEGTAKWQKIWQQNDKKKSLQIYSFNVHCFSMYPGYFPFSFGFFCFTFTSYQSLKIMDLIYG